MDRIGRNFGNSACGGATVAVVQQESAALDWVENESAAWWDHGSRYESILIGTSWETICLDGIYLCHALKRLSFSLQSVISGT